MIIRKYQPSDCEAFTQLFYQTVHTVNAKDYTQEQCNAWASGSVDLDKWDQTLHQNYSLVAVKDDTIVALGISIIAVICTCK